MVEQVDCAKYTEVPQILEAMAVSVAHRKSSRVLASHMMLDVIQVKDPRGLVLTACLYLEHIVILSNRRAGKSSQGSLTHEIRKLHNSGTISEALRDDMLTVVTLRNAFAHELFFDLAGWNPQTAPFLSGRIRRMPKPPHLRRMKNMALVKILLVHIVFELTAAMPWIRLEDVPPDRRKRSNKSLHPTAFGGG